MTKKLKVLAVIGFSLGFITALFTWGGGPTYTTEGNQNYEIRIGRDAYIVESYTRENGGLCIYLSEPQVRHCGEHSIKNLSD